tara:strand:+ start:1645 stop:2394 length:750 start_codon:yes stop_codon:yes gene_type:complete
MASISGIFDTYSLRAQYWPGMLVLLPAAISIAVLFPELYKLWNALLGLVVSCGAAVLPAHYARSRGRIVEKSLVELWGGLPTTKWLRHKDATIDQHTKDRYHRHFRNNIPEWEPPTREFELEYPLEADSRYVSAVRWQRERTRDKMLFPLIFSENVSYGFRRNMRGVRWLGLVVSMLGVSLIIAPTIDLEHWDRWPPIDRLGLSAIVANALMFLFWLGVVRNNWVEDAADAYARALLASCDQIAQNDKD